MNKKDLKDVLGALVATEVQWPELKIRNGAPVIEHTPITVDELFGISNPDSNTARDRSVEILQRPYVGILSRMKSKAKIYDQDLKEQYPHKSHDELTPYLEGRDPREEAIDKEIYKKNALQDKLEFGCEKYNQLAQELDDLARRKESLPNRGIAMKDIVDRIAADDAGYRDLLKKRCHVEIVREHIENIKIELIGFGVAISRVREDITRDAPKALLYGSIEILKKRLSSLDNAIKLHTDYAFSPGDHAPEVQKMVDIDKEVSDQIQTILSGIRTGITNIFPEREPDGLGRP